MLTALVLGGAACLWEDIAAAEEIGRFRHVVACNDAGAAWSGRLDIWATLHPDLMAGWAARREARGYPPAERYAYHRKAWPGEIPAEIVSDYHFLRTDQSPSSGIFAAKVAIEQGFERVVLCGIPLTAGAAHFFDAGVWDAAQTFRNGFRQMAPHLLGRVRSMSGHTRDVLGAPTAGWLAGRE